MVVLDATRVDRITAAAQRAHPGRTVLTVIAAVLWSIGWTVQKALAGLWFVAAWAFAAARVGWDDARGVSADDGTP